jgi:hypothetical protein
MTHPCVKCGKEMKYVTFECFLEHGSDNGSIALPTCINQSCPAYSFLQAGLKPITKDEK